MVSVVQLGGMQLATSSPSCKAIKDPVTPGNWQVLLTISFGVQWRFSGSPNISARFCGAFRVAPVAAGAGQAGAGWAGADRTGTGWGGAGGTVAAGVSSSSAGASANTCPAALNNSGISVAGSAF